MQKIAEKINKHVSALVDVIESHETLFDESNSNLVAFEQENLALIQQEYDDKKQELREMEQARLLTDINNIIDQHRYVFEHYGYDPDTLVLSDKIRYAQILFQNFVFESNADSETKHDLLDHLHGFKSNDPTLNLIGLKEYAELYQASQETQSEYRLDSYENEIAQLKEHIANHQQHRKSLSDIYSKTYDDLKKITNDLDEFSKEHDKQLKYSVPYCEGTGYFFAIAHNAEAIAKKILAKHTSPANRALIKETVIKAINLATMKEYNSMLKKDLIAYSHNTSQFMEFLDKVDDNIKRIKQEVDTQFPVISKDAYAKIHSSLSGMIEQVGIIKGHAEKQLTSELYTALCSSNKGKATISTARTTIIKEQEHEISAHDQQKSDGANTPPEVKKG